MSERPKVYGIVYLTSRIHRGEVVRKYVGRHKWRTGQKFDTYLGSGVLLTRAIKKYGRGCFVRETLQECYSHEELNQAEAYWVDKLGAVENPLFYNLALGGQNTANINSVEIHRYGLDGRYIDSFNSSAAAAVALGIDRKSIYKASSSKYKTVKTFGGFQWRKFRTEKIDAVSWGCEKPIKCYSLKGDFIRNFDTAANAARWVKAINGGNITACCKGKRPAASRYQWRYEDHTDVVPNIERESKFRDRPVIKVHPITQEVIESFTNAFAASQSVGCNQQSIRNYIKRGKPSKGFIWKYAS